MKIEWNKVTRLSQIVAVVLFVGVFCFGLFLGRKVGVHDVQTYKDCVVTK